MTNPGDLWYNISMGYNDDTVGDKAAKLVKRALSILGHEPTKEEWALHKKPKEQEMTQSTNKSRNWDSDLEAYLKKQAGSIVSEIRGIPEEEPDVSDALARALAWVDKNKVEDAASAKKAKLDKIRAALANSGREAFGVKPKKEPEKPKGTKVRSKKFNEEFTQLEEEEKRLAEEKKKKEAKKKKEE